MLEVCTNKYKATIMGKSIGDVVIHNLGEKTGELIVTRLLTGSIYTRVFLPIILLLNIVPAFSQHKTLFYNM